MIVRGFSAVAAVIAVLAVVPEAYADLKASMAEPNHKDPRRSPKWFKRAEMETRELVRRLQSLSADMSFNDRPEVEAVQSRVQEVHDNLLQGIMESKKK